MFRNRWVRRGFVGLLVGLILLVIGLFVDRSLTRRAGEKRYTEIVAHLDATDPRWRYDEIDADRGSMPDDQNGALLVPRFKATLASPPFDRDRRLPADYVSTVAPNHVLDNDTYEVLEGILASNAEAVAVAREFNEHPKGMRRYTLAPNPFDTLMPEVQDTRLACRLLDLAAERAGRDGRGGVALWYIRPMVNLARSLDGEPFFISALVRLACLRTAATRVERTLALADPRGRLAEVQALLLAEAEADLFWYSVRGERATMDRIFANLRNGTLSLDSLAGTSGPAGIEARASGWLIDPHLPNDHATFLEIMSQAYDIRHVPDHLQPTALKQVEAEIKALSAIDFGARLTRLLTPAFSKVHDANLRVKAQLRCAAVGVAAERFRLAHGRWPVELVEIQMDILTAVPLDPFDGQPLRYVKRDDGVTVYSIGPDGTDDGGNIPVGKTSNRTGQDIGFRLYDPARRGLPAKPPDPNQVGFGPVEENKFGEAPPELGPEPREVAGK
jgi:hypothetical protein